VNFQAVGNTYCTRIDQQKIDKAGGFYLLLTFRWIHILTNGMIKAPDAAEEASIINPVFYSEAIPTLASGKAD
jgi:hypothetical protein